MEACTVLKASAWLVAAATAACLAAAAFAAPGGDPAAARGGSLRLPALFCDEMVLQRDVEAPIWGWAAPHAEITIDAGPAKDIPARRRRARATADAAGRWTARLGPLPAGGPYDISIRAADANGAVAGAAVRNVLAGEVWLCAGQSNMELSLRKSTGGVEAAAAADCPQIRYFRVAKRSLRRPGDDVAGRWVVCSPRTAGGFAGVAYFFGRTLHDKLGVPVGLIDNSWSGAAAESLLPLEAIAGEGKLAGRVEQWERYRRDWPALLADFAAKDAAWRKLPGDAQAARAAERPRRPKDPNGPETTLAGLYNGMVAGLAPFTMRGITFYQGENNVMNADQYRTLFPLLIRTWRRLWRQGDMPFLFVQIANFGESSAQPTDGIWPRIRDAQLSGLGEPNTAMVVTIDVGGEFHAPDKRPVGERLALAARALAYGERRLVYCGPLPAGAAFADGRAVVTFRHVGDGLASRGGGALRGFALAGADRRFVWAEAHVAGPKRDRVEVSCPAVAKPLAVRYAWDVNPVCNLVNSSGLPACPFRSDDWPMEAP